MISVNEGLSGKGSHSNLRERKTTNAVKDYYFLPEPDRAKRWPLSLNMPVETVLFPLRQINIKINEEGTHY